MRATRQKSREAKRVTTQTGSAARRGRQERPDAGLHDQQGIPLTRERWIKFNWLGDPPQPWGVEHEMEVPELSQDHTKVEG